MSINLYKSSNSNVFRYRYQLGYSGIPEHGGSFEKPSDASTFTVPVEAGDLVLLATDGLFDNLDLEEIVDHVRAPCLD